MQSSIDKRDLTAIDWAYGAFWREYPFLRLMELKRVKKQLEYMFSTTPVPQMVMLQTLVLLNTDYLKVHIGEVIHDISNEINDIEKLLKGKKK
jgi:pyruvate/oxaloacetate carboxyltransferase